MLIKLVSYNVNGLRSALSKGLMDWIDNFQPDIICLQEIKATKDQIDSSLLSNRGYHHYWFPAEKKGYSGVALFSKIKPSNVVYGMNNPLYDFEGRLIRSDFEDVTHLAVYFPSGTSGEMRQKFKMKFLEDFSDYIDELLKVRPNLIISGDLNIAHKEVDINFPEKHHNMSGFLPEERAWVDKFLAKGFVDTFRIFNQSAEQYSWWTYRAQARLRNIGWRIDYNLVSQTMVSRIHSANIHPDILHSDHCPVSIDFDL